MISAINGATLRGMVISAANALSNRKKELNDLNVFPVPDGDTGTNMSMTILAASGAVEAETSDELLKIADKLSSASLRGARGNSGVILSQLIRGFSKAVREAEEIDLPLLAKALKAATDTAYRAVMKPTEGTILTVARYGSEYAEKEAEHATDLVAFLEGVLEQQKIALAKTPEMLPALKQAKVVDAGGAGLVALVEGALSYLKTGEIVALSDQTAVATKIASAPAAAKGDIEFRYCTEFIIQKYRSGSPVDRFRSEIAPRGDCMLVIDDDDIVKVHIHTNNPGFVLEQAVKLGTLVNIKIDNMEEQHNETLDLEEPQEDDTPEKDFGFVTVAAGDGFAAIFRDLGCDVVIEGGQTMNPSTEDILNAINKVHARHVFVLPNNKNIILAAEQAKELAQKGVSVIPTKTIPQGVTALFNYDETCLAEENESNMCDSLSAVKTLQVTFAARSTVLDDQEITEGDYLGLLENKLVHIAKTSAEAVLEALLQNHATDAEMITLYYGEDVSEENANALVARLEEAYPDAEVQALSGGQPLYYYIASVE
ncbi:MAG: DAK2 domain-containing protein [Clostridia bacterium]|nr:DAK2 domain-containing protein [Clostridia bacterium]